MDRTLLVALSFGAGIGAGLLIARWYARHQVAGGLAGALGALGVSSSTAESVAQGLAPLVTG